MPPPAVVSCTSGAFTGTALGNRLRGAHLTPAPVSTSADMHSYSTSPSSSTPCRLPLRTCLPRALILACSTFPLSVASAGIENGCQPGGHWRSTSTTLSRLRTRCHRRRPCQEREFVGDGGGGGGRWRSTHKRPDGGFIMVTGLALMTGNGSDDVAPFLDFSYAPS